MLFDLSPYLPFNAFIILTILAAGAIACYVNGRDGDR